MLIDTNDIDEIGILCGGRTFAITQQAHLLTQPDIGACRLERLHYLVHVLRKLVQQLHGGGGVCLRMACASVVVIMCARERVSSIIVLTCAHRHTTQQTTYKPHGNAQTTYKHHTKHT